MPAWSSGPPEGQTSLDPGCLTPAGDYFPSSSPPNLHLLHAPKLCPDVLLHRGSEAAHTAHRISGFPRPNLLWFPSVICMALSLICFKSLCRCHLRAYPWPSSPNSPSHPSLFSDCHTSWHIFSFFILLLPVFPHQKESSLRSWVLSRSLLFPLNLEQQVYCS